MPALRSGSTDGGNGLSILHTRYILVALSSTWLRVTGIVILLLGLDVVAGVVLIWSQQFPV